jgi:hypothetical protein
MLWSIEYYAQFFDVDTKQVLDRCWAAVFPKTPFLDVLGGNPDLYGISIIIWSDSRTILDIFHYHHYTFFLLDIGWIPCCNSYRYQILLRLHSVDCRSSIDVRVCRRYTYDSLGGDEMVWL